MHGCVLQRRRGKGVSSHRSAQTRSIVDRLGVHGCHPFTQGWHVPQRASNISVGDEGRAKGKGKWWSKVKEPGVDYSGFYGVNGKVTPLGYVLDDFITESEPESEDA